MEKIFINEVISLAYEMAFEEVIEGSGDKEPVGIISHETAARSNVLESGR